MVGASPAGAGPAGACFVDTNIVVPAYNVEAFLDEFFACVLRQTYAGFRIVFVDDCSTDGTREAAERFGAQLGDRFVLLGTSCHSGLSAARNAGLDWIAGHPCEYVTFLDADDVFEDAYLDDLHARAVLTGADLVIAGIVRVDGATGRELAVEMVQCPHDVFDDPSACTELAYINPCSYAKLYRGACVEGLRFREVLRSEDTCYLFDALPRVNGVAFTNRALYRYRTREGSLTASVGSAQRASMHKVFGQMLPAFEAEGLRALKDMFEVQVFIRSSIGGVLRQVRNGSGTARALATEERGWLDRTVAGWRTNPFLSFRGRACTTRKQRAVKACAFLYRIGAFPLFVGAYRAYSWLFKREVRV